MKRLLLILVAAALFAMLLGGVALAASPQDIYNDYSDNGKLDSTYTLDELKAYLGDAAIHQYGDPVIIERLDDLVTEIVGYMEQGMTFSEALAATTGTADKTDEDKDRDTFPFTGFELVVVFLGGCVLVGSGYLIRRAAK